MFREPIFAVSVCINYADFLIEACKYNRHQFDEWCVATRPDDEETREVCRRNKLKCLVTEDDKRDGNFSKGRLIERGLKQLPFNGWVVHIDSDVVLPLSYRHDLDLAHLQTDTIYGADRFMVKSWEQWQELQASDWVTGKFYGHPNVVIPPTKKNGQQFEIGARWCGSDGYANVGFYQMWHRVGGEEEWRGVRVKPHPYLHGSGCRVDIQQSHQWDRKKRQLIPEFFVAHLESEACKPGTNWKGRKSKRFGPALGPGNHCIS